MSWLLSALWNSILERIAIWTLKTLYWLTRLVWWLCKHKRNRAYFVGQLYLINQKILNDLVEQEIVTSRKSLDRIHRYNEWMSPKITKMLRDARDSLPAGPSTA